MRCEKTPKPTCKGQIRPIRALAMAWQLQPLCEKSIDFEGKINRKIYREGFEAHFFLAHPMFKSPIQSGSWHSSGRHAATKRGGPWDQSGPEKQFLDMPRKDESVCVIEESTNQIKYQAGHQVPSGYFGWVLTHNRFMFFLALRPRRQCFDSVALLCNWHRLHFSVSFTTSLEMPFTVGTRDAESST